MGLSYPRIILFTLAWVLFACAGAGNQPLPAGVDPQTGYRMERYRAPVPETLLGATVVDTQQARKRHENGSVIFIDVYPPKGLGPDPLEGSWITNEKHENIPGSTWLPEVGRGHLEATAEDYFRRNLNRLTQNDLSQAILFYCTSDCWQSWNAAKRALNWGHTNVYWYPNGTDGWQDASLPLEPATPVNFLE